MYIVQTMPSVAEVEKFALELPEHQRAVLAVHLLHSLPAPLQDDDEGIAEAIRRDSEMDSDPSIGISLEDFTRKIQQRRCH
jgi:hypothetical protein